MTRFLSFALLTAVAVGSAACHSMEVATGSRIQTTTTPGTGPTPLQSDAQRTAIYNSSGQTALPTPGTPAMAPLNQQVSDVNTYRPADLPPNQSPNLSPESRTQQQIQQPAQLPRP